MFSRSLSSRSSNSPTSSDAFFSSPHANYDINPNSNHHQNNTNTNSLDENERIPEGIVPISLYIVREVWESVCYQLTNWYTRISLLIGYLMILLLTFIFLYIAGYFELVTQK